MHAFFLFALIVSCCLSANFEPLVDGNARFSALTPYIFRAEYSPNGKFDDDSSFSILQRPLVNFTQKSTEDWLVLRTSAAIELHYKRKSLFSADSLFVISKDGKKSELGSTTPLVGTLRTLDGSDGGYELDCTKQNRTDLHCTSGIISRDGVVFIEDSITPRFEKRDSWDWVKPVYGKQPDPSFCPASGRTQCGPVGTNEASCASYSCCWGDDGCYFATNSYRDIYVFAHGLDFKKAIGEYMDIGGKVALPLKSMLGVWYSRYWAYSDTGMMEVVREYEDHTTPLDVLITDMDWHLTFYKEAEAGVKDQAGLTKGWTGFTWDLKLFPDPSQFLKWCKAKKLRNALNLHPASGIQPWEETYDEVAKIMGIDPSTQRYVACNLTDSKYVDAWFSVVLKPLTDQGLDWSWLDWQQGEDWISSQAPGYPAVNPTWWLNYLFFTNPYHWGSTSQRPIVMHRWGGLGNHRYPIGFSGDVTPSWPSLKYQPYFTASAANVLYGHWSHDIGGHTRPTEPELYTRWVQAGIFFPIFRPHCTKIADNNRLIWTYPLENYQIMRRSIRMREALVPMLYTFARIAYDTGVAGMRPMYYEYPDADEAYLYKEQFMWGADIVVAPSVTPAAKSASTVGLSATALWVPSGRWVHWPSQEVLEGPMVVQKQLTLAENNVLLRSGSILVSNGCFQSFSPAYGVMSVDRFAALPCPASTVAQAEKSPAVLQWTVFGDGEGSYDLYEDDGGSTGYQSDRFSWTSATSSVNMTGDVVDAVFTIHPVRGSFDGMLAERSHVIAFRNSLAPTAVTVNGETVAFNPAYATEDSAVRDDYWTYDGTTLSVVVVLVAPRPANSAVQVAFSAPWSGEAVSGAVGWMARAFGVKLLLDEQWGRDTVYMDDYPKLLLLSSMARRITFAPTAALEELERLGALREAAMAEMSGLSGLEEAVRARCGNMLSER